MSRNQAWVAVICLAVSIGAFAVENPKTLPGIVVPAVPMKFLGGVSIQMEPKACKMMMSAWIWKGGRKTFDGKLSLMGQLARVWRDAWREEFYVEFAYTPHAGSRIALTYRGPEPGAPLFTGTAVTPPLLMIGTPAAEASVDVSGAGELMISWSGGNPPYRIEVHKLGGPRDFVMTGIAGTSIRVPFSRFAAGSRYRVNLYDSHVHFAFDRPVDPSTHVVLGQIVTYIFNAI